MARILHMHPSEEELELCASNRFPDSEIERVEQHIMICSCCLNRFEELADYVAVIKAALDQLHAQEIAPTYELTRSPTAVQVCKA